MEKKIVIMVLSSNCTKFHLFFPNTDTNNFVIVTDTNTDTNTGCYMKIKICNVIIIKFWQFTYIIVALGCELTNIIDKNYFMYFHLQ